MQKERKNLTCPSFTNILTQATMEIEKIVSTLREKTGQTSLSDRTIKEYANLVMPAEGTEPDEAFFTLHSGILKSLGGNLSSDVASQVNAFKTQWEKDHPKPDPATGNNPDPNNGGSGSLTKEEISAMIADALKQNKPDPDPAIKTLTDSLKTITDRFTEEDNRKVVAALMEGVKNKAGEFKISEDNIPLFEIAIDNVTPSITKETTADKASELVKAEYERLFKRLHPAGGEPFGTGNGNGGNGNGIKDWIEQLKKSDEAARAAHEANLKNLR